MPDNKIPQTNPEWVMKDALLEPPPKGEVIMYITIGGVLLRGYASPEVEAWCHFPKIPPAVKERISKRWTGQ